MPRGADHARQPRHGAVRAATRRRVHIPIFGSDEIADVTGAGDTVIATMTLALAAGAHVRRGGAAGQLRRRPGGDEARHRHGVAPSELRSARSAADAR